jgi:hypothetical protein
LLLRLLSVEQPRSVPEREIGNPRGWMHVVIDRELNFR